MKAERRHELKENDLAHAIEVGREYVGQHSRQIGLGVLAVIVVIAVVAVAIRTRAESIESAWRKKGTLQFAEVEQARESLATLQALAQQSSSPTFALSTWLELGTQALRSAQQVPVPPDPEFNNYARNAFQNLLKEFPTNPIAQGAAHMGLATVAENDYAIDGDVTHMATAREHLEKIRGGTKFAGTPFAMVAADRLEMLDEVFSRVQFVTPTVEEQAAAEAEQPADIQPKPIKFEDLPEELRRRVQESINKEGITVPQAPPAPAQDPVQPQSDEGVDTP